MVARNSCEVLDQYGNGYSYSLPRADTSSVRNADNEYREIVAWRIKKRAVMAQLSVYLQDGPGRTVDTQPARREPLIPGMQFGAARDKKSVALGSWITDY